MKELNSLASGIVILCNILSDDQPGAIIMEATRTTGTSCTLSELRDRIEANLEDLDWVLEEGYYNEDRNRFAFWKHEVRKAFRTVKETIEVLNCISSELETCCDTVKLKQRMKAIVLGKL